MNPRIAWCASVLVSLATAAALARSGAATLNEPSRAKSALLGGGEESPTMVTLEGFVVALDGSPAEGAVVVSSAGGKALTDVRGRYRLDVEPPAEATSVQVTAVGRAGGTASTRVTMRTATCNVDPLRLALGSSCSPAWLPTFGATPGTNLDVHALAVHDDGSGPALYVGGAFTTAGGTAANRIVRWDGSSWSALGTGMDGTVRALAVYDDGSGPALYAGGSFTSAGGAAASRIARWDGSSWSALGSGVDGEVLALVVHDDGGEQVLAAGGAFATAGGVTTYGIAKWNGSTWASLGKGLAGQVRALTVFDSGSGPALHAGGDFTQTAGGLTVNHVARWNGTRWLAVGAGVTSSVTCLDVFDDGSGPALFAGGSFTSAGGAAANRIARWDGSSWSPLASGMNDLVESLEVYDDGSGPALYAGGSFTRAGGVTVNHVARWDGSTWSALAGGMSGFPTSTVHVRALRVHDDGSGPALYAGGAFGSAGGVAVNRIAKWDGTSWSVLGSGTGLNAVVDALAVYDDGTGPSLFAGGSFTTAGGVAASYIARWDGSTWSALDSGTSAFGVSALAVYDDGGGPALYAGGYFVAAGGVPASNIAKWDGSSWSALGSGVNDGVNALTVHDDGSGPALYAGGPFTTAGGVAASRIARWNGSTWSALGSGMNSVVDALAVYDDGGGPALYAGGQFTTAGGLARSRIARWNGSTWLALGTGMSSTVLALAVYDDGGGPALVAGGAFSTAGGTAASRIARWNGSSWSALGSGVNSSVAALAAHDDGGGPALYAGGFFTTAGGTAASFIAKWDGSSWSALGSGMSSVVYAVATYDDGGGPALYAGGGFTSALDSGDSFLAKWGCLTDTNPPVLSCPSSITVLDRFPDGLGEAVTFTVTATDDLDPSPVVACVPPSGSTFPPGPSLVDCTATDASGNVATCQFLVTVAPKARER